MREVVWGRAVQHFCQVRLAAAQVIHIRTALRSVYKGEIRGKDVVIHQIRAVADFHKQVSVVVVIQVVGHPNALGLPIQPGAQCAVVNAVMMDFDIEGGVQLDAGDFVAEKLMLDSDVVNMVVVDLAKSTAHMANYSVLPTVVDDIVADNMGANLFLAPTDLKRAENRFHLILVTGLLMPSRGEIVAGGGSLPMLMALHLAS